MKTLWSRIDHWFLPFHQSVQMDFLIDSTDSVNSITHSKSYVTQPNNLSSTEYPIV